MIGFVVTNIHVPAEDKDNLIKDSYYEELESTFDLFPRYYIKTLGYFNVKVGHEDIFKPT